MQTEALHRLKGGYVLTSGKVPETDGRVIYSYGVVIAAPDPDDPEGFLVTEEQYSVTTTIQCRGVTVGLLADGFKVRTVDQAAVNRAAS